MKATTAVVSTTIVQIATAFAALTIPSLTAVVQTQPGFHAINPGTFISILYAAAAVATIFAGIVVQSLGPIRTCQVAVFCCAAGLTLALHGSTVSLILGALALGLGYGPITPASSQLLSAATSTSNRRLIFSFKQTGVPAGTALAGALIPVVTVDLGWKAALILVAAVCIAIALAIQPLASRPARVQQESRPGRPVWWRSVAVALAHPYLRLLSLSAFVLGGAQMCASTFLASYFFGNVGYTALRAGAMLTVANVSGAVFRLIWGAVADRGVSPRFLLAGLSLTACLAEVVMASAGLMANFTVAVLICFLLGAAVIGWNGLLLSEVADAVPAEKVAAATAGCLFFSFGGVMTFPAAFGIVQRLSGGFDMSWLLMAGANALLGVMLLTVKGTENQAALGVVEAGLSEKDH
ncbi:transmembrane sugar transporter [Caballeronia hypogeia]|uniref:Transmembrane sugar transporter n=1 Tax=Caballeronia hypogeia TaxID=1777140 RepID=A0A158DVD4_9BURK|nr:MFS transporter [Caballeronia hypogeia]SAK98380.1 transmembrane sugar transporter [Caballeronia hypogeia]